jgi:choline-sulfatase
MRSPLFAWVFLACLVSLAPAAQVKSATGKVSGPAFPNIILITLDTTRADRMGFIGSKSGLTPNLDSLARDGVVFERAFAHVPLTTPSHANIFTGTYPQFDHLTYMGQSLAADLPFLPDILHRHGYRTAAFVGSYVVDGTNPIAAGFGRGFDIYESGFHARRKGEDRYHSVERRAEEVVDRTLKWLDANPRRPFFLWVHCYDPHAPYDPPEPYKSRYAAAPYDGEIAYTDAAMGKFLSGLRTRGLYDGSVIAVMADHGEGLGEHGELNHGIFLYDGTLHVPLAFKLPKNTFAGGRVEGRVRLVDVAPTILQVAGLPVPQAMQGESLLRMMKATAPGSPPDTADADRPAYAESDYATRAFGWSWLRSWRTGKYLYVDAPEPELYDQSTDPGALKNVAAESKAVAGTMQSQVDAFRQRTKGGEVKQARLTPEQAESLRALGYVGSDAAPATEGQRGPDPKSKKEIADLFGEAMGFIQENDYEAAVPKLEQVLREEPNTSSAYLELGRAYVALQQYEKAVPLLKIAVIKLPGDTSAQYKLSEAMAKTGDWAGAAAQLESVVKSTPSSAQMHLDLAVAYQELKRYPEAIGEFRSTLKIDPDNFGANLMVGRLLGMHGDAANALPYLQRATELKPDSGDAHRFLGSVYEALGREEDAAREQAIVEGLPPAVKQP